MGTKLLKGVALALAALAVGGGGAYYGAYWWQSGRFLESTDDAYLKADYTTIAPKVSGYIAEVSVADNESVKTGQILARIDDRDFRTALAQVEANVASAEADIRSIDAQMTLQDSMVAQAKAGIAADEAAVAFAKQDDDRFRALVHTGFGTVQKAEASDADYREKMALLARDQSVVSAARQQIEVLKTKRNIAERTLDNSRAALDQARLNLGYAVIRAPIDGVVGARSLRVGQYVQAGTELMAVVPLHSVYVVANFKETQLTDMRSGEPAAIEVDSFPGVVIHGHIDSLAPASGLEFSLLPPDNATGNFTKIVQRIPVKVAIDSDDPLIGLLRPGMSVTATVDTKSVVLAENPTKITTSVASTAY